MSEMAFCGVCVCVCDACEWVDIRAIVAKVRKQSCLSVVSPSSLLAVELVEEV